MIEKRKKYLITIVVVFVLLFTIIFYRSLEKQNTKQQINSSDISEQPVVLQTQTKIDKLPLQTEQDLNSPKNAENTSHQVDMNDLEFLTNDIIETVDWELLQSQLKDPKQVVKIRAHGSMPYYKLAQAFDQNDLPEFYEILNDDNSSGYERMQAINFIGQISDRGNHEAAKVLMDYVQKKVTWDKWQHDADNITFSKWNALGWLGCIGGEAVETFLKKAITPEGVREIAKQWMGGVPTKAFSEKAVLENLRGYAAQGLAYSDDPKIHELIRSEYEREKQACIDAGKKSGGYFNQLCDAMARIDVIKDIGLEAHKALSDGEASYTTLYLKYVAKYSLIETPLNIEDLKLQF